jgi:hypothetical protein
MKHKTSRRIALRDVFLFVSAAYLTKNQAAT